VTSGGVKLVDRGRVVGAFDATVTTLVEDAILRPWPGRRVHRDQ
jgi:hypothetical protein